MHLSLEQKEKVWNISAIQLQFQHAIWGLELLHKDLNREAFPRDLTPF